MVLVDRRLLSFLVAAMAIQYINQRLDAMPGTAWRQSRKPDRASNTDYRMQFIRSRVDELSLLLFLAKTELQRRNAGSVGGWLYVFAGPLVLVLVMWLAIDYGLGMRKLVGPEFGLRLIVGMILWLAILDIVNDSVFCILRNPHLVKKMVFPVHLLPMASVVSGFAVHIVIFVVTCFLLAISGQLVLTPASAPILLCGLSLQVVFTLGLALAFSALNVVVRDMQSIVPMGLSIGFWVTPIIWQVDAVPSGLRWLVALNPVAVGVEAYRVALLGTQWPFGLRDVLLAIGVCVGVVVIGLTINKLLRPNLSDTL